MAYLYPRQDVLQRTFSGPSAFSQPQRHNGLQVRSKATPYQARPELYQIYSIVDDTKKGAKKLSAEATAEFEKASTAAQTKTGKIELYSAQYYAACTFGGLLACVSCTGLAVQVPITPFLPYFHSNDS